MKAPLCPDCRARWMKALDAKMPPPPIVLVQVGGPSAEDIATRQLKRADEHFARIREFQAYLERTCERKEVPCDSDR